MVASGFQDPVDVEFRLLAGTGLCIKDVGDVVPGIVLKGRRGPDRTGRVHPRLHKLAGPDEQVVCIGVLVRDSLGDDGHPFVTRYISGKRPCFDGESRHPLQFGGMNYLEAVRGIPIELQSLGSKLPIGRTERAVDDDGRGIGRCVDGALGTLKRQVKHQSRRVRACCHQGGIQQQQQQHISPVCVSWSCVLEISGHVHGHPPSRKV